MATPPFSIARARALAFAGGLATGLACGFGIAAVVIGFAGTENPGLSVARSREQPTAGLLHTLLVGLAATISHSVVVRPLERRLEAAGMADTTPAKLTGFAVLGLVPGLAVGALLTLLNHGRW
jgi:hypothetical protein